MNGALSPPLSVTIIHKFVAILNPMPQECRNDRANGRIITWAAWVDRRRPPDTGEIRKFTQVIR